jgi:hypothetical protein
MANGAPSPTPLTTTQLENLQLPPGGSGIQQPQMYCRPSGCLGWTLEAAILLARRRAGGSMVATLDQRTVKLLAMAKKKCEAMGIDLDQLLATPESQVITDDAKLIRELVRLLTYIDSLR